MAPGPQFKNDRWEVNLFNWIKKAFFQGLIVLIPLVLLWVTLRELMELLVAFAEPMADAFPRGTFDWVRNPELVSTSLILVIVSLAGALAHVPGIRAAGSALERNSLGHLPLYCMTKTFVSAFLEVDEASSFRPALTLDDQRRAEPCYVIADSHENLSVVVLVPESPASFAESVKLVPRERIRRLDITFDEFSLGLANFGLGMNSILKLRRTSEKAGMN